MNEASAWRRRDRRPRWWAGGAFAALAGLGVAPFGVVAAPAVVETAPRGADAARPVVGSQVVESQVVGLQVVGDAIPAPLTGEPGDAARGRRIVVDRQVGLCLLCHSGPFPEERAQGDIAPALTGAGARWSAAQLRLRIADSRRIDPGAFMPSYHRTDGLTQVGAAWRGQPVLSAQQIEDVVAFLVTLRE